MGKLLKFLNACFKRLALHGVLKSLILISSLIFGMNSINQGTEVYSLTTI